MFEKSDYGNDNLAKIDNNVRAPSTNTGGSFYGYDTGNSDIYQVAWWMWYDGQPLSYRGVANNDTDRWSFYIKLNGTSQLPKTGCSNCFPSNNFHIGTYVCDYTSEPSYGTGDGCPYEGPGNQHYYHYLALESNGWIHVELDEHPQHRRGSFVAGNNPTMITDGFDYMAHLNQFYMEIRTAQAQKTNYWIDEMKFYSTQDTVEPNQNDISITSVWVGYFPENDKWQISWQDQSYENASGENTNDYTNSAFQVRWSTEPITNDNFEDATPINAEYYSGESYTGLIDTSIVRRPNSWSTVAWTQFELPDDIELNNNQIFFAIKDVSIEDGNKGTSWPYNRGDGHDAVSEYIHTIDYYLRPDVCNNDGICDSLENGCNCASDCSLNTNEICCDLEVVEGDCCSNSDCNDNNLCIDNTCQECSPDNDNDNYGSGLFCLGNDCNDNNPLIHFNINCNYNGNSCGSFSLCQLTCPIPPQEVCNDGLDNDCDGLIDCQDSSCLSNSICSKTIIDFNETNLYSLSGWNTLLKNTYTNYVDIGPGGMTITVGTNGDYDFQGVSGTLNEFNIGDKILVNWYNNQASPITFKPRISFDDNNRIFEEPSGTWYYMDEITIEGHSEYFSTFEFNDSTKGNYSLVNVNVNYNNNQVLICDKINYVENSGEEPSCTPNWNCSNWSSCLNGNQTQTCVDLNSCFPNYNNTQTCSIHQADSDHSGIIEFNEVYNYIQLWLTGDKTMNDIIEVINLWKENK